MIIRDDTSVVLNTEQLQVLRTLFSKRTRICTIGFFGVLVLWLRVSVNYLDAWYQVHYVYSKKQFYHEVVDKLDWAFATSLLLLSGFLGYFGAILWKRIIPLYKDIKYQSGIYIDREIIRKSIPYHNMCFFFFDDLKIPYKEVDHTTYYAYKAGDRVKILIGRHSKTHIDEYLNGSIL